MTNMEWLRNLSLSELNLINTYMALPCDYPMKNAGRRHFGFLFTLKGEEIYRFSDRTIRAVPNSIVFIPKNEQYTIDFEGEESVVVTVDFEANNEEQIRPFIIKLAPSNALKSDFNQAEGSWIRKSPESYSECLSFFFKLVSLLIHHENHYSNSATYKKIESAVRYLHANYLSQGFKIEALSHQAKMSPRYFEILFESVFNMTPKEYIIHLKLSLARELLLNEKNTVTSVAAQLGFNDVYHFSRTFKAKTGLTPTQYKRNNT